MAKKKYEAELKAIVIFCEKLGKEVIVRSEDLEWISVGDADLGDAYGDAKCECGETHHITLDYEIDMDVVIS